MKTIKKIKNQIQNPSVIVLLTLITAATILRLYDLGTQSVWFDEATSAIAARSILQHGSPIMPSGEVFSRAILHKTLVALSFKTFGFSTVAGRIPAAFFGTFSIIVSYFLGRKLKNKRVGLILAFFITFSTVQIAWSRQIRMYQQLQFFFLLSLYFLERFLDNMSWKSLVFTLIPVFCMTISHDAFGYLLTIPLLVWFLIDKSGWLKQKITNIRETNHKNILIMISLAAVLATLFYLKGFRLTGFVERATGTSVNYAFDYYSHFWEEMGYFFILAMSGAVLGFYEGKNHSLYVLSFSIPFFIVAFHVLALQHRYVFMLFPLLFLFAALTLEYVYEAVKKFSQKNLNKKTPKWIIPTITIGIIITALIPTGNYTFTPKTRYDLGYTAPQAEFRPAYQYIENNWRKNDVIISTLPSVTWYYLQRSDYWISFSYWGLDTKPETDHYTGAKVIQNKENIQKIIEEKQGWIVIEEMGKRDIDKPILNFIQEKLTTVKKVSGEGVWVYRFD